MRVSAMEELIDAIERDIRNAFAEVIAWLHGVNTEAAIASRIEAGLGDEVVAEVERAAYRIVKVVLDGYQFAGEAAAEYISSELDVLVDFDVRNVRALAEMDAAELDKVVGFVDEQRATVRGALVRGMERGLNPVETAREVRQSIGLTPYQDGIVDNYRRALERVAVDDGAVDDALGRELRDRRFDRTVRAAKKTGKPLTRDQIDKMVGRYRERWIKFRAETISRTESLTAAHAGVEEMWRQALESGEVRAEDIEEEWHVAGGTDKKGKRRTRDSHWDMRGQKRAWGVPFLSGDGNLLRYPGDPSAPASDTIRCRCMKTTRLKPSALLGKRHAPGCVFGSRDLQSGIPTG